MADGDKYLIEYQDDLPLPLGRAGVWHDPRNRMHAAMTQGTVDGKVRNRPWYTRDVFDQIGPSCTVATAIGVLRTQPKTKKFKGKYGNYDTEQERFEFYRDEVRKHDPWHGEAYDGSSTDAPFKALTLRGELDGWQWLFGLAELREWVQKKSAVAVGTNWYRSMFYPNKKNELEIIDADGNAGGHAWRIVYYDLERKRYLKVGSWGRPWGINGRAWVPEAVMERLLAENGECAVPVYRS